MRVYEFTPDSDRYQSLTAVSTKTYERLSQLTADPVEKWTRPNLRFVGATRKGDFPNLATHFPIVSDRALEVIRPYLSAETDILPVNVPGGGYNGLHIRDLPSCLDHEMSDISWFEPGHARKIKKYVFREKDVAGHHFFRLPEYAFAFAYLSGELFDAIREAKLEGLADTLLWEM